MLLLFKLFPKGLWSRVGVFVCSFQQTKTNVCVCLCKYGIYHFPTYLKLNHAHSPAWKIVTWATGFDTFPVYQTTN